MIFAYICIALLAVVDLVVLKRVEVLEDDNRNLKAKNNIKK